MPDYRATRLPLGIKLGILLSFTLAWAFSGWSGIQTALSLFLSNPIAGLYNYVSRIFSADIDLIGLIINPPADIVLFLTGLFSSNMFAWIITAGIAACIAKGLRRGLTASIIVYVIDLLIWILIGILSGEDLLAMFSGDSLLVSIGTILGGLAGVLIGGSLFGLASGPSEGIL